MDPNFPEQGRHALAGRELPKDLVQQVSNITMGQLFYIMGHIQKLSAQAPVTAQRILAENPQICHALLHAECLAGMLDEPVLPLSADELQRTKEKAQQMQEEMSKHELPPPAPPPAPDVAAPGATAGGSAGSAAPALGQDQKAQLMQKLMQLSPEQISRLPQNTKMQLLSFLEQNKRS
mmetsp:Transcript_75271/g.124182  ORF Transcript_75271/g.124182 Transcript_75271/m.124182 type:complete len:178 (-) Transcript_75271:82-615(-)